MGEGMDYRRVLLWRRGSSWERGGLCLAGRQFRDTSTLQGQLMQKKERVPKPRGPPDLVMPPKGAPHLCYSLNTIEQLQLPGSGQVLAS